MRKGTGARFSPLFLGAFRTFCIQARPCPPAQLFSRSDTMRLESSDKSLSAVFQVVLLLASTLLIPACRHMPAPIELTGVSNVQTFKLENGLTVYAVESPDLPIVTLDMWVRTGSKDEPPEIAGVSHFLEHMLFKGTPRLGVGEYDRRIEELGGYLNAATSTDYTHYYMTLPAEHLDRALEDMADVLLNSSIDSTEVEKERLVILEEIRQKQDNPIGFLYDEITRAIYESGPYAGTVIGSPETVTELSQEQLRAHYRRYYTPENMAFVAVGDFNTIALRNRLEELLGGFSRKLEPWRESVPTTTYAASEGEVWPKDWQQTYFFITLPATLENDLQSTAVADVLESLLVQGRTSRLVNSLREKKGLVTSINGFAPRGRYPGFWAFYGTCEAADTETVRAEVIAELDRLAKEGPASRELARAKRKLVTEHLYQTETTSGKASMIGYSHALLGDSSLYADYPAAVEAVTVSDVQGLLTQLDPDTAQLWAAGPVPEAAAPRESNGL